VAADLIVGDHGSAAVYGAAVNVPVVLAGYPSDDVDPASAGALLGASAPRLSRDRRIADQLADAQASYQPSASRRVAERLTSEPGRFSRNMRRLMYRQLGLSQPATIPAALTAKLPDIIT
jgi:hypothetical protein